MPPAMARPPGAAPAAGVGPVTVPQHNPGNMMQAQQKLGAALRLIEEALPTIPIGAPLHQSALKIATDLRKHIGEHAEDAAAQRQVLVGALRGLQNAGQMQALARMAPQGQAPATAQPTPMAGPVPAPAAAMAA